MVPVSEYFRSVEVIWIVWLAGIVVLLWLTRQALRGSDWKQWSSVFKGEDGAAYSLSYVLVFPIYVLLVVLVIECTLILVVKLGTIYAAYAAARSQIVWSSVDDSAAVKARADRAAIHAMVPFSSSWEQHARQAGIDTVAPVQGEEYFFVYNMVADGPAEDRRYIANKHRWAAFATSVKYVRTLLGGGDKPWFADIKATVEYRMPLHVTWVGRFLGQRFVGPRGGYYLYSITSSVTLQDEAAQNDKMTIGFRYVPR
jgi:hypothetical protein